LGELLAGFHKGQHFQRNEKELQNFIETEVDGILSVDPGTAEHYAAIRDYLRKAGTPVAPNDLWIAATAMQYGLKVISTDRDFEKIPQILIQRFGSPKN
jgi:predicted nucleic acid-binding protein